MSAWCSREQNLLRSVWTTGSDVCRCMDHCLRMGNMYVVMNIVRKYSHTDVGLAVLIDTLVNVCELCSM